MNRWRKKRDIFGREGSAEGLADVNEQELAKDTARDASEHGFKERDSSDKENVGGSGEPVQIVRVDTDRNLYKELNRDKAEPKNTAKEEIFGEFDNSEPQKENVSDARGVFYKTVITLSMLISLLIFALVVLGAYFDDEEPIEEAYDPYGDESDTGIRDGDRVIYIRDLDENSDIMTTAEIYSKNSASVVTVMADIGSSKSIGTGFVISTDGYIATACHTLDGADSVKVIWQNGKSVEAQIVGKDALSDLALLRVYTDGLSAVELGDSDELLVGERIVAIGTPHSEEFSGSVFSGNISSCNRIVSIYDDSTGKLEKKMNFVQLSATLGRGCSGCPIFDSYGKVIGILSARLGDGTNGVCFAIPINGASEILGTLKENGSSDGAQNVVAMPAPKLGVLGISANESGVKGVKISSFSDESCDASKKLKAGDIIVSIGERKITSYYDVTDEIGKHLVGDSVLVTVYRSGQYLSFDVELTE